MIHHFYHVYADGGWQQPVEEHVAALEVLDLDMRLTVGVVGRPANRVKVMQRMWGVQGLDWVHGWDAGYEQRTLGLAFDTEFADDDLILYAHSKGAGHPLPGVSDPWRRCMTRHLITEGRSALEAFKHGADTVGCHWLTPAEHPDLVTIPYYGGNFWWATGAHIKRLPPPSDATRYHAEAWLGTVPPHRAVDLQPGWPGAGCAEH